MSGGAFLKRIPKSAVVIACVVAILAVSYLALFRGEVYVRNGYGSALKVVEVRFNGRNVMEVNEWSLAAQNGAAFNSLPAPLTGRHLEFVLASNPAPGTSWSCTLEGPVKPWCYYEVFFTRNGLVCNPCGKSPS